MRLDRERLLQLLPAIYRLRDEEGDGTLSALLGILAQQAEILAEDVAQLHDDQFIETAAEWVVPYIADLVGARGVVSVDSAAFSARAYVANTIRYRRRKGTIAVIEQLARDVTGWPAAAVEYFQRLITTTNVNHVRHDADYEVLHPDFVRLKPLATVDLRDWNAIERLDSAFEVSAHTADVRRISSGRGRYNIPNVGIFLWRLDAYPLTQSPAVKVDDQHFLLHPLGIDSPLYTRPATETEIEHLAEPLNVPLPVSRRVLDANMPSYYGTAESDHSILLFDGANAIDINQVHVCDLSDGSGGWSGAPAEPVAIDPVLGRLAFKTKPTGPVAATFHYGFPADLGGGEYEREASFALGDEQVLQVPTVAFPTITKALQEVQAQNFPKAVIEITASGRYEETLTIELLENQDLEIRAANGRRPTVILGGDCVIRGAAGADLHLNGLLIAGGSLVVPNEPANKIGGLNIAHCTLVPGLRLLRDKTPVHPDRPSVLVESPNDLLRIKIEKSITGALHVSTRAISLSAYDSIIDGGPPRAGMAILSGRHTGKITLTEAAPAIDVTVGAGEPGTVTLEQKEYTVVQMRDALQPAIRNAGPEFGEALVLTDKDKNEVLVLLSGTSEPIAVAAHDLDAVTIAELLLAPPHVRVVRPFISDRLADPFALTSPVRKVEFRIGGGAWHSVTLTNGTIPQVRDQIRNAINAIAGDAYKNAIVTDHNRRLLILPGIANADVEFRAPNNDRITIRELGLLAARLAIGGPVAGADAPPLTLERCTILGGVRAVALPYVSDTIFSAPVIARRKQTGCVRFSFVPEGSQTPRRYRCQPDLEVEEEVERRAKKIVAFGFPTKADLIAIRAQIVSWLVPGFVSTRYGDAAYVQLTRSTPRQVRAGSEKGSEMGVYEMLQQPQREANLRAALDEYLRFGLEAGIFYAS